MIFAAPLMLLGLAGLAAPIVIHLLDRARSSAVDWPTLRFLQSAQQQSAQRRRLRHLLVLMLRLLLLGLLVLAMARPYRRGQAWQRPPDLPTTLVLVLDNSYSMGYHADGAPGSRFERAVELALEQVATLRLEDEVAVVLANMQVTVLTERPTRDRARVARLLRDARLSSAGTDLAAALTTAFALARLDADAEPRTDAEPGKYADAPPGLDDPGDADSGPTPARPRRQAWRQVLLLTDMQRLGWSGLLEGDLLARIEHPAPLTIVDVGAPQSPNRCIRRARVADRLTGQALRVDAELCRHGAGAGSVAPDQVTMWIDDRQVGVPQRFGAASTVQLSAQLPDPGTHAGAVQLDEDRLPIDDRAWFAFKVEGGRRLTIVNGDPSDLAQMSETWFFETALGLDSAGRAIPITALTPQQLSDRPLEEGGCLLLANVERLDAAALRHVEDFLLRGGCLLVALGDRVDIEHYRAHWRVLPLELQGRLGDPGRSRSYAVVVDQADHPVLAGPLDLAAARFFCFIGTDPTTLRPGARILASFSNGSPALVEGRFGDESGTAGGRVMLLTSAIDDDWSNLPYRRVFLPLVDRLVAYLTESRIAARGVELGRTIRFSGPADLAGQSLTISGPDEVSHTLVATLDPTTGEAAADFGQTGQVGIYRVSADPRFNHGGAFAVNLDTRESDLAQVEPEAVRKAFGDLPVRIVADRPASLGGWYQGPEPELGECQVPYWPWLLLACFVLFGVESLLANLFTRRRPPPPLPETAYLATRRTESVVATIR